MLYTEKAKHTEKYTEKKTEQNKSEKPNTSHASDLNSGARETNERHLVSWTPNEPSYVQNYWKDLDVFAIDYQHIPSILNIKHIVDEQSLTIYPADTVLSWVLFPVTVSADENCLLYWGIIMRLGMNLVAGNLEPELYLNLSLTRITTLVSFFWKKVW